MTTEPTRAEVLTGEDVEPIAWAEARRRIAEARFSWLATSRPDGRPHVRPCLTIWMDGQLHSTTRVDAAKGRHLAADGRCSMSVGTDDMDLVVEGVAEFITDADHLQRLADAYREKYGWPPTVVDGAFDAPYGAPTAGEPPYQPYAITPDAVYAFGTSDDFAPRTTRFTF
ncbi:pyridoxamine 5'-phosphate oxidase family protein [Aquihabitans daechungensis]|uniref:pyridoxamine 5'-phosphate oxidase family protein n=1 Tax=Aquihabitans daechungensis TaxID=1052257 RepID=UPI003BA26F71